MLDFNTLLDLVSLDPADTLIVRHFPVEKRLRRVLPWLVEERPELWLTYQRIQWETLEKAMTKGKHIASFIGLESAGRRSPESIRSARGSRSITMATGPFPGTANWKPLEWGDASRGCPTAWPSILSCSITTGTGLAG